MKPIRGLALGAIMAMAAFGAMPADYIGGGATGRARQGGKTYAPNGKREVARRLSQAERIAAKQVPA